MIKGDYIINEPHQMSVHYLRDYYTNLNNLTSLVTYTRKIPGTNAKAQWTFVANPTTVNTLQFSFSGNVILQGDFAANPVFLTDYTRKGEGITLPMIYGRNGTIPTVNISGYNGLGASDVNWNNFNRLFNLKDDFSKLIGQSQPEAGHPGTAQPQEPGQLAGRQRHRQLFHRPLRTPPATHSPTRSSATSRSYTEANTNREGWYRFTQVEPYVQDDWKVSNRLTLNLGFRYQYMPPQYCALHELRDVAAAVLRPRVRRRRSTRSNGAIVSGTGDPYNGLMLGGTDFPMPPNSASPDAAIRP